MVKIIFVLWGEDKSQKNTLALSFPKPLVDMEFDIGGFDRANRNVIKPPDPKTGYVGLNIPIKDWFKQRLITVEPYVMPFQIGDLDPITSIIRPSKRIVGVKELFYKFAAKFIQHLKDPELKTIMVDTGTLLHEVTSQGFLQEKQEAQFGPNGNLLPGEKLMTTLFPPVLYRDINIRMRGFIYQAKAHRKNLVLTHHATDEYGMVKGSGGSIVNDKTGKRALHGWSQLGDGADVVVYTYWDKTKMKPYCKVELAEVKELEDMVFEEPTYDKIQKVIKMVRGEE